MDAAAGELAAHAFGMVLKLDSRAVQVWRDPFSLQFGIEPVRAVLREVSNAEERMIAALGAGISRSGLAMIAKSAGADERTVDHLLTRLDGLLVTTVPVAAPRRVSIVGRGPTTERIADALAIAGVHVAVGADLSDSPCDLGITIGHYVLDPDSYGFWLRRDLPHLAVTFGDESATIGPLVEPGATACLFCLEHYRRDADASRSAIASQLWGRHAESETPLVSIEVAARVARLVLRRLAGEVPTSATSVRLETDTGETTTTVWMPHPDCGCTSLGTDAEAEAEVSADRPETGSVLGSVRPRTAAKAFGRA